MRARAIAQGGVAIAVLGTALFLEARRLGPGETTAPIAAAPCAAVSKLTPTQKERRYHRAPELVGLAGHLNTERSPTLRERVGRNVVLIDFWTYSCINCQRTLPYLNAWYEKYHEQGLEIIGVHTPEFTFEHAFENVRQAMERFGIAYPVVLDNDYATWRAYRNQFWPRKYLIDIDGYVVFDHIGEGAYAETEANIQELLCERAARLGVMPETTGGVVAIGAVPGVTDIDARERRSPEVYFGSLRNEGHLVNGAAGVAGVQEFRAESSPSTHTLSLGGVWRIDPEYAESAEAGSQITYRYRAKHVYMVASATEPTRVRVLRDGEPLRDDAGVDVAESVLTVGAERLYHIVADDAYGEHTLQLIADAPGFRAYTFTFG